MESDRQDTNFDKLLNPTSKIPKAWKKVKDGLYRKEFIWIVRSPKNPLNKIKIRIDLHKTSQQLPNGKYHWHVLVLVVDKDEKWKESSAHVKDKNHNPIDSLKVAKEVGDHLITHAFY